MEGSGSWPPEHEGDTNSNTWIQGMKGKKEGRDGGRRKERDSEVVLGGSITGLEKS